MPSDLATAIAGTSEFQRIILIDGHVTYDEYERAIYGTVQCLKDNGVRVTSEPRESWRGQLDFAWESTTQEQSRSQWAIYESCSREHDDLVSLQYFYQVRPTEQERSEARIALVDCLRINNIDVSDDPTSNELRGLAVSGDAAFQSCRSSVVEDFDFSDGWLP